MISKVVPKIWARTNSAMMEGGGECRINENERDSNKDFEDQIRKREKMKSFKRTEERGREESSVGRCGEGTG